MLRVTYFKQYIHMNTTIKSFLSAAVIFSLVSCSGGGHEHAEDHGHDQNHGHDYGTEETNQCLYEFVADSTILTWTAYKTGEKVPVSGTFDELEISGTSSSESLMGVFEKAEFKIRTGSVNSANPDRDAKIAEHFFGKMSDARSISGSVAQLTEENATVVFTMNGISMKQEMMVETDGKYSVTISANLDVNNWNLQPSLAALNEVCSVLHTGADGESKLWDEVRVELRAMAVNPCD